MWRDLSEFFSTVHFSIKMNELELLLLQLLKQASMSLAETQAELKEAKRIVANWRKLKDHEDWEDVRSRTEHWESGRKKWESGRKKLSS